MTKTSRGLSLLLSIPHTVEQLFLGPASRRDVNGKEVLLADWRESIQQPQDEFQLL